MRGSDRQWESRAAYEADTTNPLSYGEWLFLGLVMLDVVLILGLLMVSLSETT